jgi:hypothetical protein
MAISRYSPCYGQLVVGCLSAAEYRLAVFIIQDSRLEHSVVQTPDIEFLLQADFPGRRRTVAAARCLSL